jgi:two-component system sensor histidine kinase/response regulator
MQSNDNQGFSQCRLLLVEDNRINQEVARHILAEFDIIPDIAINGLEALVYLKATKGKIPYDIILMDCQMPEMDGYQATKAIRNGEAGTENKTITVIAMTANTMKGDKEKCLASGMTDYLSKPIEPEKIKEKLAQYVGMVKIAKVNNQTTIIKTPSESTETTNSPKELVTPLKSLKPDIKKDDKESDKVRVWRKDEFAKRLNNNTNIQLKLIELFLEETPKQLSALSKSIDQQDNTLQHDISHKIQGMSANLSAQELLECTKAFNQYIKSSSPEQVKVDELFQTMMLGYQALEVVLMQSLSESLLDS